MQRSLLQAGRHLQITVRRHASSSSSGVSKDASQRFRQTAEYFLVSTAALAGGAFITWQLTEGKRKIALDAVKSQPDIQSARRSSAWEVEDIPTTSGSRSTPKPPSRSREPSATSQVDIGVQGAETEGGATEGITVAGEGDEDEGAGGAFNPITGEINWDCPCLGGMAHGPCGQQFRDAFSCFVYSEDEPKGINCVDRFQLMQDCFREHPDIYAEEISDDETSRDVEAEVDKGAPSIPENSPSDDTQKS